ncbi:hypothetical protein KP612_07895 [Treponema denticola]|uniref:Bulb-type lectin domain-containing protein n=1 Tax=Treponema denticola H-22 TaxID=999432 RepID=A0A0E2E815_TREDN|nr:hypothetical protein [Treponema denticola]EMB35012.1 hypothetical protein HMPREF9726_00778 [Treponema denticola H-22]
MKKLPSLILFIFLCFSSCNFFMQEEYGELVIDLEGSSSRAIGSNGLPEIASSELYLQIIGETSGIIERKFEAGTPKFFSENFPIGEKLKIRVRLSVVSASWETSVNHTVTQGTNNIMLKLNKIASGNKKIAFSIGHSGSSVSHKLRFENGTDIGINASTPISGTPGFARDSKGRLYFIYKDSSQWKIKRFTSEGAEDTAYNHSSLTSSLTGDEVEIFSDRSTGDIYVLDKRSTGNKLYKTDGTTKTNIDLPSNFQNLSGDKISRMAIYDKFSFIIDNNNKLHSYNFNGTQISGTSIPSLDLFANLVKINSSYIPAGNFKSGDIFVNKNKLYVLFSAFSNDLINGAYSLGGILEYTYNDEGNLVPARKLGFSQSLTAGTENIANIDEASNFYGAAKIIGFEDETIYIADDGYKLQTGASHAEVEKNKNRIANLNTVSGSLSFEPTDHTWFEEKQEAAPPTPPTPPSPGKMIIWTKNGTSGYKFYEVTDEDPNISGKTPLITGSGTTYPLDVCSFDKDGNLYVVWKVGLTYKVRQYTKNSDGSFNTSSPPEQQLYYDSSTKLNQNQTPIAIAVDTSNNSTGYLIYSYNNNNINTPMEKNSWTKTAGFNSGSHYDSYTILSAGHSVMAMAVSPDGLFVAIENSLGTNVALSIWKYVDLSQPPNNQKYALTALGYHTNPGNADNLAPNFINDMYIKDGALYILAAQYKGRLDSTSTTKVSVGGSLLKLESLSGNIQTSPLTNLWPSGAINALKEDYAPYRFIKTGDNQMVIASDGYNGNSSSSPICTQLNKLVFFNKSSGSSQWQYEKTKDTDAQFSKELNHTGGQFTWK